MSPEQISAEYRYMIRATRLCKVAARIRDTIEMKAIKSILEAVR